MKLDPTNTELVAQKQKLLAESVETSKARLDALRQAQADVERQMKSGDLGEASVR